MLSRILLVGAALIGALILIKQEGVLERVGLLGSCGVVATPAGESPSEGQWWSCTEGKLTGFPVLDRKSCESRGFSGPIEVWYCPTGITVGYKT